MTPDTNPRKPEWFELAESDAQSTSVRKVNKKLPAIAVLITGAILGAGALFANGSGSDANAEQAVTQTVATSSPASSPASSPTTSASATPTAIANPAHGGIQAPTGRGDDGDGEGDHHKGDREDHVERD